MYCATNTLRSSGIRHTKNSKTPVKNLNLGEKHFVQPQCTASKKL